MKKYYSFAGVDIEIEMPDEVMYTEERYLDTFRCNVNNSVPRHCFSFEVVKELTPPEGTCIANEGGLRVYAEGEAQVRYIGSVQQSWENAYLRVTHRDCQHRVQLKQSAQTNKIGVNTVLNCLAAEHLVARAGGFIFHSSYIELQGKGILFTAPSGTGKSTQAALWEELRHAEILNGDRSAVRCVDGQVQVCGVPFAGSSRICRNKTLPLGAIVYLKQAPKTTIRRLRGAEAFRRVWEGCSVNTWDRGDVMLVSDTVQQVVIAVPVFELACTPDESAIIALEEALGKEFG
jgi:hypothetical protein